VTRIVAVTMCAGLLSALLLGMPSIAIAGGAPVKLYNKSITVHWSEDRSQKQTDGTAFSRVTHVDLGIYISNAGRLFRQLGRTVTNSRGKVVASGGTSAAPDGSIIQANKNKYSSTFQFIGRSLTGTTMYESGARRITITFDDGFRSCNVSISHGKEDGAPGLVMHSVSGRFYMLTSISISGASCSLQDGNIFGGAG